MGQPCAELCFLHIAKAALRTSRKRALYECNICIAAETELCCAAGDCSGTADRTYTDLY